MHAVSVRKTLATVLFSFSIAFALFYGAAPARAQGLAQLEWGKIGISGGTNLERIGDLRSTGVTASFENAVGYHVGVSYDQSVGPVFVRPGLVFRRAGTFRFPASFDGTGDTLLEGRSFDVWVFEVPVDVRYQYRLTEQASVYAFAGPMLSIPRAEADFDRSFPNATLAAEGGIGGEFDISVVPLVLAPELRYSRSITGTVKEDFQFRGRSFDTEGLNLNGFSIRLHVYYPLPF